jgi:hypothetical protein
MLRPRGVGEPGTEEGMMREAEGSATGGSFGGLDAKLTVFALANGVDLAKGEGYRRLEWFTEGLERGILLEPCAEAACRIVVMAWKTGKAERLNDHVFADEVAIDEVPRMLDDAIEAANGLQAPAPPD